MPRRCKRKQLAIKQARSLRSNTEDPQQETIACLQQEVSRLRREVNRKEKVARGLREEVRVLQQTVTRLEGHLERMERAERELQFRNLRNRIRQLQDYIGNTENRVPPLLNRIFSRRNFD